MAYQPCAFCSEVQRQLISHLYFYHTGDRVHFSRRRHDSGLSVAAAGADDNGLHVRFQVLSERLS